MPWRPFPCRARLEGILLACAGRSLLAAWGLAAATWLLVAPMLICVRGAFVTFLQHFPLVPFGARAAGCC